jgi:aminoglycoside phosphotransferase (APT) family kinase protein
MKFTPAVSASMANVSNTSSDDSSDLPSFVSKLDLQILASLATQIRARSSNFSSSVLCTVDPQPKSGSYNVVFTIRFEDGLKWIARLPKAECNPTLTRRLELDVIGMRFIQDRTTIPLPPIYDFNSTEDNVLGRPYMIQSFVDGSPLSELWFDPDWFTKSKRLTVWRSLASYMSELSAFEFSHIGSLDQDPETGAHFVSPLHAAIDEMDTDSEPEGPYSSTHT